MSDPQLTGTPTDKQPSAPPEDATSANTAPAAEQAPISPPSLTGSAATETPTDVAATTPPQTDGASATPAEKLPASARLKIGTQRPEAKAAQPKATAPSAPQTAAPPKPKQAKNYPPPNVRAKLTPEEEAELEAAFAGQSLEDLIDSTATSLPSNDLPEGSRLQATVSRIYQDHVFFDLGGHRQGVLQVKMFEEGELPEPGTQLDVVVVKSGDDDGLYELSRPNAAVAVGNWDEVEEGQVVEVTVTGVNKGGLECQVAGIRGFMPMGQISIYRVENAEEYVGQRLTAVVTEAKRDKRNLVLSGRAVMEREKAEKREKLLQELAPGQLREGIVRSLRDFGAFVDLGGVDGLVHISKMSWDRISHPSEVLKEGETIKVKIDKIDPDTGKIGLSYRDSAKNPWDEVSSKYPTGTKVTGTVSKTMDFGAFVKLEAGVEGLIHISELAHGRVHRVTDVVNEGQTVEVKILAVDRDKQRISLSLRALMEPPKKASDKEEDEQEFVAPPDAPKAPTQKATNLKGGIGRPSGGEQFGLNW